MMNRDWKLSLSFFLLMVGGIFLGMAPWVYKRPEAFTAGIMFWFAATVLIDRWERYK